MKKVKGPGRGWWGPPKGTHGPGSQGAAAELIDVIVGEEAHQGILNQLKGIPEEHFEGLQSITTVPPLGYSMEENWFRSEGGKRIRGQYCRNTRTIHIHPKVAVRDGGFTALHEMGHHVSYQLTWDRRLAIATLRGLRAHSDDALADLGLRRISTRHLNEFWADTYMVRIRGGRSQWDALQEAAKLAGKLDLNQVYGALEK